MTEASAGGNEFREMVGGPAERGVSAGLRGNGFRRGVGPPRGDGNPKLVSEELTMIRECLVIASAVVETLADGKPPIGCHLLGSTSGIEQQNDVRYDRFPRLILGFVLSRFGVSDLKESTKDQPALSVSHDFEHGCALLACVIPVCNTMVKTLFDTFFMVILDVIPLIALPRSQSDIVSYFHTNHVPRGTIVRVKYNNRKIKAVVINSDELKHRKEMLKKQATFALKKIDEITIEKVDEKLIKKAETLAAYYYTPLGKCLRAVLLHPEEKNYKKYMIAGPSVDLPELKDLHAQEKITIIDMRKEIRDANFSIFSRAVKEALQVAEEEQSKFIIYIPRKGYANFIFCKTCGNTMRCQNCSVSLIDYADRLRCHHCGYESAKPKTCPNCSSYNLKSYGVGIEKVEAELLKFFSFQNLKAPKIATLISETRKFPDNWDILLTTQSIFRYASLKPSPLPTVPFLAILNADALIHIPDYASEEKLLRQTLALASLAGETFVQTYNPDDPALRAAAMGNSEGFWQEELEHRKALAYPPFVQLVKLTSKHRSSEMLRKNALGLAKQLNGRAYPAFVSRERGKYVWNILLKFKPGDIEARDRVLRHVPADWSIDVDPISIV